MYLLDYFSNTHSSDRKSCPGVIQMETIGTPDRSSEYQTPPWNWRDSMYVFRIWMLGIQATIVSFIRIVSVLIPKISSNLFSVGSAEECQRRCQTEPKCLFFSFSSIKERICRLISDLDRKLELAETTSGPKFCWIPIPSSVKCSYLLMLIEMYLLWKTLILIFFWLAACRQPYKGLPWQLNHFYVMTLYQQKPIGSKHLIVSFNSLTQGEASHDNVADPPMAKPAPNPSQERQG